MSIFLPELSSDSDSSSDESADEHEAAKPDHREPDIVQEFVFRTARIRIRYHSSPVTMI